MVSPDFVEDRRVQGNVERSALSVEDRARSLHRGMADAIALPRPHFREVLASSFDVVVREVLSMTTTELTTLFQVFRTAPRYREHRLVLRILLKK